MDELILGLPRNYLLDASLYVFRAYHSLKPDWQTPAGEPTHAVHGFVATLLNLLEQSRPNRLAVCFDGSLTTSFRNRIYPQYKANRPPPDPNLLVQFDLCQRFARALGTRPLIDDQFEADDLIGTLAMRLRAGGETFVIVSADKDLGQLLGEHDRQWDFTKGDPMGPPAVFERFGVHPHQLADWLALSGDSVDNIPGVQGVGAKTAAQLLKHFGSLSALLERVEEVAFLKSLRGAAQVCMKLKAGRELALLCRQLTGIAEHAPVPELEHLTPLEPDLSHFDALCDEAGFGSQLRVRARRWHRLHQARAAMAAAQTAGVAP